MALRAAQTGHLVLSTLHTNDAISAISRLQQLGIQSHEIENSLLLVIAQRLVRKCCLNAVNILVILAIVIRDIEGVLGCINFYNAKITVTKLILTHFIKAH